MFLGNSYKNSTLAEIMYIFMRLRLNFLSTEPSVTNILHQFVIIIYSFYINFNLFSKFYCKISSTLFVHFL